MMTAFFLFVTAHSPPLPPVNCSHNPAVLSYHMHILYDVLDKSQVAAALSFREDARKQFEGLTGPDAQCALDHDTCRYDQGRLAFIDDHALDNITADAGGPFVSGEWSMFVPVPYFGTITAWFMQHYSDRHPAFSLLMHGNTGCEYEDHTKWRSGRDRSGQSAHRSLRRADRRASSDMRVATLATPCASNRARRAPTPPTCPSHPAARS